MKIKLNGLIYTTFVAATLLFASCTDELEENNNYTPIVEGDEICFGASDLVTFDEGYSDDIPQSRTFYGEATWDGTKWHYPLNWVYGDEVAVYCKESPDSKKYATYRIQWDGGSEGAVADGDNNLAYLFRVGDNSIHWGDPDSTHHFYAFYPASAINNNFKNGVVKGVIPNAQEVSWSEPNNDGNWVGKPNMKYAFMRAYNVIKPADVKDGSVKLTFEPLTTAIDIILTAKTDVTISAVQVSSRNKNGDTQQSVCGDFEYNIGTGETTVGTPDVATDYRVTVSCWHDDGNGNQVPIELKKGNSLKFTVFLLPGSDANGKRILHNLEIRVPGWNNGLRAKYYDGIDIKVGTKSQIYLPEYEPNKSSNNWIGSLPDNVYISQLSIPGSVNAFSSAVNDSYNEEGSKEIDQTQTLPVNEQLAYGVRAFEIPTERRNRLVDNISHLGEAHMVAGDTHFSDFGTAMNQLATFLANNPSEFLLVMPYYSPTDVGGGDNSDDWVEKMRAYIKTLSASGNPIITVNNEKGESVNIPIKPFTNTMTIGDARGTILLLTRVANNTPTNPVHTSVIHGWNADKDRNDRRSGDNWIYESEVPAGIAKPTYHIYDWQRVCKETREYKYFNNIFDQGKQYWTESKTEKIGNGKDDKGDVELFMESTIQTLKTTTNAQDVFINNLAGYYIIDGGLSAKIGGSGGKHGDIPPFARDINKVVYNFILGLDYESRGPLGIVLINYAGAETAFGMNMYGDYIVKALVDNNFRFPLLGK